MSQSKIDFKDLFRDLILAHISEFDHNFRGTYLTLIDQESGTWENTAQGEGLSWCHVMSTRCQQQLNSYSNSVQWHWSTVSTYYMIASTVD